MRVQVKDFMSSPVITAVGETPIGEIKSLMNLKGIHSIPIVEYSKESPNVKVTIRGIITDSDINGSIDDKTPVEKVMTPKVHVAHKDSSSKAAAKMMLKHKVHHIVVMDEGKIIGIISSLDFVNLVAEHTLE